MIQFPEIKSGTGPVLMLNLIKFKDRNIYFEQYLPAFAEVVKQLGIQGVSVKVVSEVVANIIAEENNDWDEVMLVEYPSPEAFKTIAESEVYQTQANPLRLAGTEKLTLIMTREIKL